MFSNLINMYNFSPGPGALFNDVLQHVQMEMLNWNNSGMSILELNHRSPEFRSLLMNTKNKLRLLVNIYPLTMKYCFYKVVQPKCSQQYR